MSQSFSPYVTVYDTRQNPPVGELVYRASLPNYMRYSHYTTTRPANAVASPNLRKSQLPTAQREQNRQMNNPQTPGLETNEPISGVVRPEISSELVQTNAQAALQEIEPKPEKKASKPAAEAVTETPTDDKPKRSQPRRRAKADSEGGTDGSTTVSTEE